MTGALRRQRLKVGDDVPPPERLVFVPPAYPQEAQDAGIQGIVLLSIAIGEDGTVIEVSVLESIPQLDQAAIDAVRQWRYAPTYLNGEAVEIEMDVTINFTLS
jgi:TonB family protein